MSLNTTIRNRQTAHLRIWPLLLLWLALCTVAEAGSPPRMALVPGYAVPTAGGWRADIQLTLYQEDPDETHSSLIGKALRELYDIPSEGAPRRIFDRRWMPFKSDPLSGKSVLLALENRHVLSLPASDDFGQIATTIEIPRETLDQSIQRPGPAGRWFHFSTLYLLSHAKGRLLLLPEQGVSIISDIDDTIKLSEVRDRKRLMQNTFAEPYRAIPGMADLYRELNQRGLAIHYVSASPWQLHRPLQDFLSTSGFPAGTLHLFNYRVSVRSAKDILKSGLEKKLPPIERLLRDFPNRRFILIGDSGEEDRELYSQLAARYPQQVMGIHIRDLDGNYCAEAGQGGSINYFCTAEQLRQEILQRLQQSL